MPRHQQKKLHATAAAMATTTVFRDTAEVSTSPVVIDRVTADPKKNGAISSAAAIRYRATRGRMAREAITPARMLDESRYPFRNEYSSARPMSKYSMLISMRAAAMA